MPDSLENIKLKKYYLGKNKNCFPTALSYDVEKVFSLIPIMNKYYEESFAKEYNVDDKIYNRNYHINLQKEKIIILDRVYFDEPNIEQENELNETQKQILNCIYTRHHNGFIREKRLKNLLNIDHNWVIPFKILLLGEYVFEITEELDKHITENNVHLYKAFTIYNQPHWQQTKSRIQTYWDIYHSLSKAKIFEEYVGHKIMKKIDKQNTAFSYKKIGHK